jgi:hypothetical protein
VNKAEDTFDYDFVRVTAIARGCSLEICIPNAIVGGILWFGVEAKSISISLNNQNTCSMEMHDNEIQCNIAAPF